MTILFKALAAILLAGLTLSSAHAQPKPQRPSPNRLVPQQHLVPDHWGFQDLFGSYNKTTLQEGFVVYQTSCASCHGMSQVHFRDLRRLGLTAPDVYAIASGSKVPQGVDAKGKPKLVPATPDDVLQSAYPSPEAAAAHFHGAIPQDLSLIARASPQGPRHIYGMLTGYRPAPPNIVMLPDHHYNIAVPGLQSAMAPSLNPGSVTFANGEKPGIKEMAHDVTEFLAWSADPNSDSRRGTGYAMIFFLLILGGLVYAAWLRSKERP